jgi:hypothetical protein
LFARFGSGLSPVTVAEFTSVEGAPTATWTTYDLLAVAPAAIVPNPHVTTFAAAEQPGSPLTNDSPAGSVSVATTFVSGSPPPFVAESVYVASFPSVREVGDAVLASDRSAVRSGTVMSTVSWKPGVETPLSRKSIEQWR